MEREVKVLYVEKRRRTEESKEWVVKKRRGEELWWRFGGSKINQSKGSKGFEVSPTHILLSTYIIFFFLQN